MRTLPLLLAMTAMTAGARKQQTTRPNIIFILCDDMGYGDLGCYGQQYISTPRLDSMAAEGMRFTQAYAGSPVSAPSRATLMTGQHTGHTLVRGNREYWQGVPMVTYGKCQDFSRVGQMPYDSAHAILPELFHNRGYATGMFGKWAGGYEGSCSTPDKRGIDEFYGYICQFQAHLYYPNFLNRFSRRMGDTATVREILEENIQHPMYGREYEKRTQYSADLIHRRAMQWLEDREAGEPFLGIFTYTLPHAELVQPDDSLLETYHRRFFQDRTWGGSESSRYNPTTHTHAQFAAMITRLDTYVGEILDLLKEKGMDGNTIVFFASDNGPHEEGGADPAFFGRDGKLRGLKRQCYEGGIRIPFIVRWPGRIAPGRVCDHQLAFYDILPTLCDIAGIRIPRKEADRYDGLSFAPTLLGMGVQPQHEHLYWEFHETNQMALRMGDWKMVVRKGVPELYDLSTDIHEDHNVAAAHPDIVSEMKSVLLREHTPSEWFKVTLPE